MHEAGFTEQISESILGELKRHPKGKYKKALVRVGEVFHLHEEAVLMHYQAMTDGSELKDIALQLEEIPVAVRCSNCNKEGGVEDHHLLMCSFCDSKNVIMVKGDKIEIELIP